MSDSKQRIAPRDYTLPKHGEAIRFVNDLVIDLKLQLLGRAPRGAITMERMQEWERIHMPELDRCRGGGIK